MNVLCSHSNSTFGRRTTFPMIKPVFMARPSHGNSNSVQVTSKELGTAVPENSAERMSGATRSRDGAADMVLGADSVNRGEMIKHLLVAHGMYSRQEVNSMQQMRQFQKTHKMRTLLGLSLNQGVMSI